MNEDRDLLALIHAVVAGEDAVVARLLKASPDLARARVVIGASRHGAPAYFLDDIRHYIYAGDTALHLAAAAYREAAARKLIALGADVHARNRRGAEPLHYAVDGGPGASNWNPAAQTVTIALLLGAGADANAVDKGGVTPLHRAIRNRCAAAVRALLDGGADVKRKNKSGSTPMLLATQNTGRGGTGSADAKHEQEQIVQMLRAAAAGARARARSGPRTGRS